MAEPARGHRLFQLGRDFTSDDLRKVAELTALDEILARKEKALTEQIVYALERGGTIAPVPLDFDMVTRRYIRRWFRRGPA